MIIIHRADGRGAQSPRGGNITTETEKGFAFPPLIRDNITCVFLINMRAGRPRLNILYYYYTLALLGLSPSFSPSLSDSLTISFFLSQWYGNSRRIIIIIFSYYIISCFMVLSGVFCLTIIIRLSIFTVFHRLICTPPDRPVPPKRGSSRSAPTRVARTAAVDDSSTVASAILALAPTHSHYNMGTSTILCLREK